MSTARTFDVTQSIRYALLALGGVGTAYGIYLLLTTTKPSSILGLSLWLAAALVLHDGILSPLVFAANLLLKRLGRGFSWFAVALIQVLAFVSFTVVLIAIPVIGGKQHGARNATVVPLDYTANLTWSLVTLVTLGVLGLVLIAWRVRRARA